MKKFFSNPILANAISLIALAVAITSVSLDFREQQRISHLETGYFRSIDASVLPNLSPQILPIEEYLPPTDTPHIFRVEPAAVASVWVEVKITNTGFRTFSIDGFLGGLATHSESKVQVFGHFGYPTLGPNVAYKLPTSKRTNPINFPIVLGEGSQVRFYCELVLPIGPETAKSLEAGTYKDSAGLLVMNALDEQISSDIVERFSQAQLNETYLRVLVNFADGGYGTAAVTSF